MYKRQDQLRFTFTNKDKGFTAVTEIQLFHEGGDRDHPAQNTAPTVKLAEEWRGMGQNYLKSLLALGFQAFLIMVVVGIYAVLIQQIGTADDISGAIWGCMGYTVLLCFCLFKTGSISKAVFTAH